jgi:hypothetical protein
VIIVCFFGGLNPSLAIIGQLQRDLSDTHGGMMKYSTIENDIFCPGQIQDNVKIDFINASFNCTSGHDIVQFRDFMKEWMNRRNRPLTPAEVEAYLNSSRPAIMNGVDPDAAKYAALLEPILEKAGTDTILYCPFVEPWDYLCEAFPYDLVIKSDSTVQRVDLWSLTTEIRNGKTLVHLPCDHWVALQVINLLNLKIGCYLSCENQENVSSQCGSPETEWLNSKEWLQTVLSFFPESGGLYLTDNDTGIINSSMDAGEIVVGDWTLSKVLSRKSADSKKKISTLYHVKRKGSTGRIPL